jgi:hypothetical protein
MRGFGLQLETRGDGNSYRSSPPQAAWPNVIAPLDPRRTIKATRGFYETIAPTLGFGVRIGRSERVHCRGGRSLVTLLQGSLTENLRLPSPTTRHGGRFTPSRGRGGPPRQRPAGERPRLHPDYYGGYFLDRDGNVVELWTRDVAGLLDLSEGRSEARSRTPRAAKDAGSRPGPSGSSGTTA